MYCIVAKRYVVGENFHTNNYLALCIKPRHAQFQRSSAMGTFSDLEFNVVGKKKCMFFNVKLAISQKW